MAPRGGRGDVRPQPLAIVETDAHRRRVGSEAEADRRALCRRLAQRRRQRDGREQDILPFSREALMSLV